MIRNSMWDLLSMSDTFNQYKKWDVLLCKSQLALDCVNWYVKILQKGYKANQYLVQNLTWSGVYLSITLSNILLQKLLTLVTLTSTIPDVFVTTMTEFLYDSYNAFKENFNHLNILKLHSYIGGVLHIDELQYWLIKITIRVHRDGIYWWIRRHASDRDQDYPPGVLTQQVGIQHCVFDRYHHDWWRRAGGVGPGCQRLTPGLEHVVNALPWSKLGDLQGCLQRHR